MNTWPKFAYMTIEQLTQIENEVFTRIIMDELKRQKAAGTAVGDYLLNKYELDKQTAEAVKKIVAQERG